MLNGCWENSKKVRGLLFSAAPCTWLGSVRFSFRWMEVSCQYNKLWAAAPASEVTDDRWIELSSKIRILWILRI